MIERSTVPGLAPPPGYAHVAVAAGRLVFTAGAVPLDSEGRVVGTGSYETQTEVVLANLEAALAHAGAGPEDVVKTTVYVAAAEHAPLPVVWDVVRASPFGAAPSTLLGVTVLGYSEQLVEIEAVAVLG